MREKKNNGKYVFVTILRELLSHQQHYDWGLRALKTILKGCGNLLQHTKSLTKESGKKGELFPFPDVRQTALKESKI